MEITNEIKSQYFNSESKAYNAIVSAFGNLKGIENLAEELKSIDMDDVSVDASPYSDVEFLGKKYPTYLHNYDYELNDELTLRV